MACTDRQLQQSQITQGFSTRNGVQQAIRPFTGEPSGSNLMDYLNRELFPVVKAMRSKVNEVYLPAKENASSANPLSYYFSESTVNADPTLGRVRLNQAVQNTATVLRVSETNGHRKNVSTWLSVMQGGSTTPLGVVTLSDAADPGRFIRFNMSALVDNGAYWDLTVTPVESSHPNPFVEGEAVLVSYIAGVASGGVSLATNIAAIRAVSAGTQLLTSGTLSFANSNNLSWGLNNGTITGSYALNVSAGVSSAGVSALVFSNDQNVSWGLSNGTITANASQRYFGLPSAVNGAAFSFNNVAGLTWSVSSFTFVNGAKTQTGAQYTPALGAFITTAETKTISLATYATTISSQFSANTDSSFSGNPLVFQLAGTDGSIYNRANVFWRLSSGSMVGVAPMLVFGTVGGLSGNVFSFSNANGASIDMTSSLDPNFGRILQFFPNFSGPRAVSAGTQQMTVGTLVFANSNNFSWGMSGSSQITGQPFFNVTGANGSSVNATVLAFTTGVNNVGFAVSTNASGATVRAAASISVSAGTTNVAASQLSFANGSGVTFGLNGSTITASVNAGGGGVAIADAFGNTVTGGTAVFTIGPNTLSTLWSAGTLSNNVAFGLNGSTMSAQAHIRVSDDSAGSGFAATRFNFMNANGVSWVAATAQSAAGDRQVNISASIDAGIGASGVTRNLGVVNFVRPTVLDGGMASATLGNVAFAFNTGASSTQIQATALMRITANLTTTGGFPVSKLEFRDGGGIQWGVATSNDAEGRGVQVTAKFADISFWNNFQGGGLPLNADANSSVSAHTNLHVFPLDNYGHHGFPGMLTASTMGFMVVAGVTTTNSPAFTHTYRLGIYTLANSSQLSLLNSCTFTIGSATQSSATFNASAAGNRYLTIHSSRWSSQPVFSHGIQYWMAMQKTNNAASVSWIVSQLYASYLHNLDFRGALGESVAISARNPVPFGGMVNTTNIPVSIAASQLASGTNTSSGVGGQNFIYFMSKPAVAMWGGLRSNYP